MATNSQTGEMQPFGITTVLPMAKSCRDLAKP